MLTAVLLLYVGLASSGVVEHSQVSSLYLVPPAFTIVHVREFCPESHYQTNPMRWMLMTGTMNTIMTLSSGTRPNISIV